MPDVFVPADTTGNTYLVQTLGDQQLFSAYVIDKMQPKLSRFASAEDFVKQYNVSDDELNNFILYISKTIKEIDSHELAQSKSTIKMLLKANAARFKWGDNAYFEAVNSDDITLVKAIDAVK